MKKSTSLLAAAAIGTALAMRAARQRTPYSFKGKSVLITGGSRGLGLIMARMLSDAGARLTILARDQAELDRAQQDLTSRGAEVLALRRDVSRREEAEDAVRSAVERYGSIDVLINNAGIIQVGPVDHMKVEDFEVAMAIHMWGPLYTMMAAIPHMREQGGGRIVNIASVAGLRGAPPEVMNTVVYHATKGGLISLTRDLAWKWARHGIYVNAIAPGWFPSDMSMFVIGPNEERLREGIPLKRFGGPDDLKGAVVFLASRASDFVTGHTLVVDGGLTAW